VSRARSFGVCIFAHSSDLVIIIITLWAAWTSGPGHVHPPIEGLPWTRSAPRWAAGPRRWTGPGCDGGRPGPSRRRSRRRRAVRQRPRPGSRVLHPHCSGRPEHVTGTDNPPL